MYVNCIGQAVRIPDAVRDLNALQLWLEDGTIERWAVFFPRHKVVKVFNRPEEAAAACAPGVYVVRITRTERNTQELLDWINKAIKDGEAVHV